MAAPGADHATTHLIDKQLSGLGRFGPLQTPPIRAEGDTLPG
jgi:hypothetical protein